MESWDKKVLHGQYEALGMCDSPFKYSTLYVENCYRPTKIGTEAPSPELKKKNWDEIMYTPTHPCTYVGKKLFIKRSASIKKAIEISLFELY